MHRLSFLWRTSVTFSKASLNSARRSRISFAIAGVITLAITAAVWVLPTRVRGHQHSKAEILPAGTISGQHTPEAIPEMVAYGLLFRTLQTLSQDPENARAYQSYLKLMQLDAKDDDGPGPRESEQAQFRRTVERFTKQIWQVDLEVGRVKNVWRTTGGRRRDPFVEGQIQALQSRKQTILSTVVADLPRDVGVRASEKIRAFALNRVRRHAKMYPNGVAQ